MHYPLLEIEPCTPQCQESANLPLPSETVSTLDVYPSSMGKRVGLGLGFLAVAILSALIGAVWLSHYLPFAPPVDATALDAHMLQQSSLLQQLESKLQRQSEALESLKQTAISPPPSVPTEQIQQELESFKRQMRAEFREMQRGWEQLETRLQADLESRNQELAWVRYQLATSYLDQRRPHEAIREMQRALRTMPENALIWNQLGYAYLETGEVARAIQAFRKYVQISPEDANAHDSLAEGYLRAGNLKLAEREYRRALQLSPTLGSAHYGLGQVYERMGRIRLAINQYERYLDLCRGTSNEWTLRARERLNALRP